MAKTQPTVAISLRTRPAQLDLIDRAAAARGKDRTAFMLEASCREAENVLLDRRLFHLDEDAWNRTVEIAMSTPNLEGATVLTEEPAEGGYTNDIVTAAHELLGDSFDLTGESYEPIEVTLEEGGA